MKKVLKSVINTRRLATKRFAAGSSSFKLFGLALFGATALFFSNNAKAVDYPTTIENTVNVTLPAGVVDNNTGNNTNGGCTVADPASAACATDTNTLDVVIPEPTKSFSPATIDYNGISTLTITLTNSNDFAATLQADFVDNLPASVIVATPANASTTCTGTLTAAAGSSSVTLSSGATIPANSSCVINVDVTSASAGTHTNQLPAGALDTGMGSRCGIFDFGNISESK